MWSRLTGLFAPSVHNERVERLIQAARVGNLDQVRRSVADGADVNGRLPTDRAVSMAATDVLERSGSGGGSDTSPAMMASAGKQTRSAVVASAEQQVQRPAIFPPLLQTLTPAARARADPPALVHPPQVAASVDAPESPLTDVSIQGATALHVAVHGDQLQVVKFLVETAGVDLNATNADGRTPLHDAAVMGNGRLVRYLTNMGASCHARDAAGRTALQLAARSGHAAEVSFLLTQRNVAVDDADASAETALFSASFYGHADVIAILIDAGADVDLKNRNGDTCLMWAVFNGHLDSVQMLLGHGSADVQLTNAYGWTAVHIAAYMGRLDIMQALHAADSCYGSRSDCGETPLHIAVQEGNTDVLEFMCGLGAEFGFDVDDMTDEGESALHWAMRVGNADAITVLGMAGADLDLVDANGVPPVKLAASDDIVDHYNNVYVAYEAGEFDADEDEDGEGEEEEEEEEGEDEGDEAGTGAHWAESVDGLLRTPSGRQLAVDDDDLEEIVAGEEEPRRAHSLVPGGVTWKDRQPSASTLGRPAPSVLNDESDDSDLDVEIAYDLPRGQTRQLAVADDDEEDEEANDVAQGMETMTITDCDAEGNIISKVVRVDRRHVGDEATPYGFRPQSSTPETYLMDGPSMTPDEDVPGPQKTAVGSRPPRPSSSLSRGSTTPQHYARGGWASQSPTAGPQIPYHDRLPITPSPEVPPGKDSPSPVPAVASMWDQRRK